MPTLFSDGLPIRLIETPRGDFQTCRPDERLTDVVARNVESYDFFPVTEGGDKESKIIGLIDLTASGDELRVDVTVAQRMSTLTEDVLIGANAPIVSFLREADRRSCRLVVSGPKISGLVTLFDLQRLPVRAALFAIVTQLEITMTDWIRRAFEKDDQWLEKLSPNRQAGIRGRINASRSEDTFVDGLLFTQFADKKTIIRKSHQDLSSKTLFESEISGAEQLRNHLAHANDYAPTKEKAKGVCRTVRSIENWIEFLSGCRTGG